MGVIAAILTLLFGLALPFSDTRLQATPLRFAGASLALFPLLLLSAIVVLRRLVRGRVPRRGMLWGVLGVCGTAAVTAFYLYRFAPAFGGTYLVLKAAKYAVLLALWLLAIPVLADQDPRALSWAARAAFAVALLGVVVCDVQHSLYWETLTHYHRNLNMRPRGFSLESSALGVQMGCFGLLAAVGLRPAALRWVPVLLALGVAVYSVTKGGQVGLILALAGAALLMPGTAGGWRPALRKLATLSVPATAAIVLSGYLSKVFTVSVDRATSISTRLTGVMVGVIAAVHNPLGMGLGGMLPAFQRYTFSAMDLVRRLPLRAHFTEVMTYAGSTTGRDLSTKSFFFDQLLVLGLPFAYLFVRFHLRLLRRLRAARADYFLLAAVLFAVIAICTYDPALGFYDVPLVYGSALAFLRTRGAPRRARVPLPTASWRDGRRVGALAHAAPVGPHR
jgi:hypothetical protein